MARPNCKECPSPNPTFNPIFPDYCPIAPAGSTKFIGNVCPFKLGAEEMRRRCANFVEKGNGCLAGPEWQSKVKPTCIVEDLGELFLCFGYKPRKN